jgi:hypothetical protein
MTRTLRDRLSLCCFGLLTLLLINAASASAYLQKPEQFSISNQKSVPALGFLIIGTVFNDHGFAFPGVTIRVRRSNESKFRWETSTNSRGEFALRVPDGQEYEVVVRVKNFKEQSVHVDTHNGDTQQRLSIKLESLTPSAGAKP